MLTKLKLSVYALFICTFFIQFLSSTFGQTDGTLTFTFTETHSGSTKNVLAVWITDNSGNFVKTRMRFWGSGTNDHLPSWKTNSSQNVVDAITGPTRTASTNPTAFGVKTVTWDGKDVTSTTVPDGTYKVFVESSWNNPEPPNNQHSTIINFTFEKGPDSTNTTPAGNSYFSDISINWAPATLSGIYESNRQNISIYPNPTDGFIQIAVEKPLYVTELVVRKINGQIVHSYALGKFVENSFSLDLTDIPSGIYIIQALSSDNLHCPTAKCIINK